MSMCACLYLSMCTRRNVCAPPPPKPLTRPCPAGLLENKAQIVVTVGAIRGLVDYSMWDPEPGPHGPFITYSYYVTYDFVEDEESMKEEFERVLTEVSPGLDASGGTGSPSAWVFLLLPHGNVSQGPSGGPAHLLERPGLSYPLYPVPSSGGGHILSWGPLMETRGCISPTV